MRKRHLRKPIEAFLDIFTTLLFIFIAMIDDMTLGFIPIYLLSIAIIVFNIFILKRFGRGIFNE